MLCAELVANAHPAAMHLRIATWIKGNAPEATIHLSGTCRLPGRCDNKAGDCRSQQGATVDVQEVGIAVEGLRGG
jgi:hypothetical protein